MTVTACAFSALLVTLAPAQAALAAGATPAATGCGVNMSCVPVQPPVSPFPPTPSPGPTPSCAPATGGPTCSAGSPVAGQASTAPNQGAGNPIDVVTGNKYQREVDLAALPGVLGLEIVRYYNSQYAVPTMAPGAIGRGWKLSYDTALYTTAHSLQIIQADGRRLMFDRDPAHPSLCAGSDWQTGRIRIVHGARGDAYRWEWNDGKVLDFDAAGKLVQITAPTGEFTTLTRDSAGFLVQVQDPQGRSLHIRYLSAADAVSQRRYGGVQSIESPVGRFRYAYGTPLQPGTWAKAANVVANLVDVSLPGAGADTASTAASGADSDRSIHRVYHYESPQWPGALTGISIHGSGSDGRRMDERLSTYLYDRNGRAVLSVKGVPARLQTDARGTPLSPARLVPGTGLDQVHVQLLRPALWGSDGQTLVTNSLGQQTLYTHRIVGQSYRLVESRGASCAGCGESNVRYGYDAQGRLVQVIKLQPTLVAHGQPQTEALPLSARLLERDDWGRVRAEWSVAYVGGHAQTPQLLQRSTYPRPGEDAQGRWQIADQPIRIERPSVVAGRQTVTSIRYNDAGQPLDITDEGWSPAIAGEPEPIRRTTTYSYQRLDNRSVLAQIDGPLPNGPTDSPQDSDITRFGWDARGRRVLQITAPLNMVSTFAYDDAGRIDSATSPSGQTDGYAYEPSGQPARIEYLQGGQTVHGVAYRYDADRRATETLNLVDGRPEPQTAQGYDLANHLVWQAEATGILRQASYDTEGRLQTSLVVGGGIRQQENYGHDAMGRLIEVDDDTGVRRRLLRDDSGHIAGTIDPLGRITSYVQAPDGRRLEVTEAANTDKPLVLGYQLDQTGHVTQIDARSSDGMRQRTVTTKLLTDDFGREVAVVSADTGTRINRYDAAGQLIESDDANGTLTRLTYDAAGRVVRRTVGRGTQAQTTDYGYEGTRLTRIQDANQTERYAYAPNGQVAAKTIELRLVDGGTVEDKTLYRYDSLGRLQEQRLPDGRWLRYERNGHGALVALKLRTGWNLFGWWQTTVVSDLQSDLIGLRSLTYGNGIEGLWQRSGQGVLARVVYARSGARNGGALRTAFETLMTQAHAEPTAAPASAPGALGLPTDPNALWDDRLLYDEAGNVLVQAHSASSLESESAESRYTGYAYDASNQLTQASRSHGDMLHDVADRAVSSTEVWRYHHDSLGNRLLAQEQQPAEEMAHTQSTAYAGEPDHAAQRQSDVPADAAGFPVRDAVRSYRWDVQGRLQAIDRQGQRTVYRYNDRGERVSKESGGVTTYYLYNERRQRSAELDGRGRATREYIWLGQQLVAIVEPSQPHAVAAQVDGAWTEFKATVTSVWAAATGRQSTLHYVHTDHRGAPIAITDEHGSRVWSADYAPFGQRIEARQPIRRVGAESAQSAVAPRGHAIELDLRLPGQWEDRESGLYYNDHRYYDPATGRYISPDPLALAGGINPFAYVGNNPIAHIDPLGLVLFAFDGTDNSDPPAPGDSISNVRKFYTAYDENKNGGKFYITGIGTTNKDMPVEGSDVSGSGFIDRVDLGFKFLDALIDNKRPTQTLDIDVVGFSRGAAEARAWTRKLVSAFQGDGLYRTSTGQSACLEIRFEGLWDTVVHLGEFRQDDWKYDLSIPKQVKYAVQAVALNEHRGSIINFYGRSIFESVAHENTSNRIEQGFIGSHADIGGGYGTGDLSNVALSWMLQQAYSRGIFIRQEVVKEKKWNVVADPIVHDKSSNKLFPKLFPLDEDREFVYGDRTEVDQANAKFGNINTIWARDQVSYYNEWCGPSASPAVGEVDMKLYNAWLKTQNVNIANINSSRPRCF